MIRALLTSACVPDSISRLLICAVVRQRVLQISRAHHQLDIERANVTYEAANRFERESLEIRLRRKAIPLAHQAGHQLPVVALSLFFVLTHNLIPRDLIETDDQRMAR